MPAIMENNMMADTRICTAIKQNGVKCNSLTIEHGYCAIHLNCRRQHGPITFRLMQLDFKQKMEVANLRRQFRDRCRDLYELPDTPEREAEINRVAKDHKDDKALLMARYIEDARIIRASLTTASDEEKQLEAQAEARRIQLAEEKRHARQEAHARAMAIRQQLEDERMARRLQAQENVGMGVGGILNQINNLIAAGGGGGHDWAGAEGVVFAPAVPQPAAPQNRNLGDIARDNQSIHTTEVVRHTKEIVAKVREIPVPEGYRWDREICSKTPGEIIAECRLTQKAAHQMMSQYAQDTSIYDIEEGIYGKVLDSVWQFVKGHAEKDSLVSIIREEMQGNIGMCAQGNLTRICNVLSGYLDGVGVRESLSEKLGRLLPPLREIEDLDERRAAMERILEDNRVPMEGREVWEDAVMG